MNPPFSRPLAILGFAIVIATGAVTSVVAAEVQFDVEPLIACVDVTDEGFLALHADERLVEARIRLSTLVRFGLRSEDLRIFIAVHTGSESLRVHDFQPHTTTHSRYVGNIKVEASVEKLRSLGITASAALDVAKLSGNGSLSDKDSRKIHYELLPPLETLTASGTLERGTGVYFKLRGSNQSTLEGIKEYVIVLRVPANWRGGIAVVQCEAFRKTGKSVGKERYLLALYLDGDGRAQQSAQRLLRNERALRQLAHRASDDIHNNAYPSWAHRVGKTLSLVDSKIALDWLDQVVFSSDSTSVRGYERLPRRVREASQAYARARRDLLSL
jgi:hypothetical protein